MIPVLEPFLCGNEKKYLNDCIDSGWLSSKGKYVDKFEEIFSSTHSNLPSVSVSSGTTALHLALEALGISEGDEVIIPNLTFAATINAVIQSGAKPVLVDVDSTSWNISNKAIISSITDKTKAIICVHLYGQPCNMKKLNQIVKEFQLLLIEDCAEALGSTFDGSPVGTFGDASIFSFFGNKTITTGEGGMVLFKDDLVAEKGRILRDHGMDPKKRYWHKYAGFNYRLTNIQAAIGLAQMENLNFLVDKKKILAKRYDLAFDDLDILKQSKLSLSSSSSWLYGIVLKSEKKRNFLMTYLFEKSIETRSFFYPLNIQPPYGEYAINKNLENSIQLSKCGLSLPSSSGLNFEDQKYIISNVKIGLELSSINQNV